MDNASARIIYINEYRTEQAGPKPIVPSISSEPVLSSRQASIDDLYDTQDPSGSFATTARSRFASIATSMNAARSGDPVERDEAVMTLQAELPRSFAIDGWSTVHLPSSLRCITVYGIKKGRLSITYNTSAFSMR